MKMNFRRIMASVLSLVMILSIALSGGPLPAQAASAPGNIDLAREVAAEGMVLMENPVINAETGEKSLPLAEGTTVAMFGRAMIDYVRGGGGSGNTNVQYTRNILQGMQWWEEQGQISLVPELVDFYTEQVTTNGITNDANITVTDDVWNAAVSATETAVVTIGRYSSEGSDRSATAGDYYLSAAEIDLITRVAAEFDNTIVVLNVGAVLDTSWIKGENAIPGVDGVLMAWQAGMEGGLATADILVGHVNPSGKFVDTFAKDYSDYPSSETFAESSSYVSYTEDIFVGYRYFETVPGAAERVNYEFGYGLSYTTFSTVVDSIEIVDDEIVTTATVTNTGSVAGKQVVQVYFSAPRGDLTKPAKELAAFDKTGLLEPGASETLVMRFPITDMSSYDDEGVIQESAYVMEAGTYRIFVGNSVRDGAYYDDLFTYVLEEDLIAEQLTELCPPTMLPARMLEDGTYVDVATGGDLDPHHTVAAEGQTTIEMEAYYDGSPALRIESFYDDEFNRLSCLAYMNTAGYYAEYELTAEAAGQYAVTVCYANGNPDLNNVFSVTVNGEVQTGVEFNATQTGDGDGASEWYNFVEAEPFYINLQEGVNLLRLTANRNNPNYDYMILERVGEIDGAYARKIPAVGITRVEAESYDETGAGVDNTATRLENFTYDDGSAAQCVAYMNYEGNFVRYYLHVEQAGEYELVLNAANGRAAYDFQPGIMVDEQIYPMFITADRTCAGDDDWDGDGEADGAWYGFQDLEPVTVNLPKGNCILQLTGIVQNQYPNIDYFTLERVGDPTDRSIAVSGTEATLVEAENYQEATWPDSLYPNRIESYAVADVSGTCLAMMNYPGNTVTYYLNAENPGPYTMTMLAANGYDAYDNFEPNIVINGVSYPATLNVPSTRDDGEGGTGNRWYNFVELDPVTIELAEGLNVLTMTCTVADAFPNLESFILEPVPYETVVSASEPTTIQAENFDATGTRGTATRLEDFTANGGGTCLAYMNYVGNSVSYNVHVEQAGTYDLVLYAANGRAAFDFQPGIYVNGEAFPCFLSCPGTAVDGNTWHNFVALDPISITLPQGNCIIRLWSPTVSYPNVDYFTLTRTGDAADRAVAVPAEGVTVEAENFHTFSAGEEDLYPVRLEAYSTDAGSGTILAFMNYIGNQVGYYLNVAEAGTYNVILTASNGYEGFDFDPSITINGKTYSATITCPQTGDGNGAGEWWNMMALEGIQVELDAGLNYLTMTAQGDDQFPNIDYFAIEPVTEPVPMSLAYTLSRSTVNQAETGPIMLLDVYNEPSLMEAFLDQLTVEELAELLSAQGNRDGGNTQGWGNNMTYGIPLVMTADGPQGIRISNTCTAWPISTCLAASWDVDVVAKVGKAAATEAHNNNMDIWLAPGMNIHRDPLCGRNFEYYSEDPLVTGKMAASITRAVQAEGVAISLKHFAANNKETNRSSSDSRMSERALREIYLRGFEIAVKEADPWTIMSSYNYINGIETAENYDLLTGILRGEWGYNGVVETDWGNNSNHVLEVLAGNDVKMTNSQPELLVSAVESGRLTREHLETGAQRVLELIMKVNYFQDKIVNAPIVEIGEDTTFKAAENIIWSQTVNAETTSDTDGGRNLGYCDAGGWAQYNINVLSSGTYSLSARSASNAGSGAFDVVVDDVVIASFEAVNTGGWQNWNTLPAQTVELTEGEHILRIEFTESGSNLNWLQFTRIPSAVTGVTLDQNYAELIIGETMTLTATVAPANADDATVTWTSDAESVATVDENGTVTAVSVGGAVITVTTADGGFTAKCTVKVEKAPLDQAKDAAIAELEAARDALKDSDYRPEQIAELDAAEEAGIEAILAAGTEEAVAEALTAAKEALDAVKTAAELAVEEMDELVTAAKEAAEKAKAEAEAAQAAAEAAQAAAEEAAASAAEDKAAAEAAKTAAELAQAQAEAAQAAAEKAQAEAEAAEKAAEESNAEAAAEAAASAASAAESATSASAAAESAAAAAEAAQAAQEAQAAAEKAAADAKADREAAEKAKEEAEKAAAEAALSLSKSVAIADLDSLIRNLSEDAAAEQIAALSDAAREIRREILAAETETQVAEILAEAEEELHPIVCATAKFTDTDVDQWYHLAVDYVVNNGIMNGTGSTTFDPTGKLSRAMMVQILYNLEGRPAHSGSASFTDVPETAWYYDAVIWAAEEGIVNGIGNGAFNPNGELTREQMVTILWRYSGKPAADPGSLTFSDADQIHGWAAEAAAWAATVGIIQGPGNNLFAPALTTTRAEAAQVIANFFAE